MRRDELFNVLQGKPFKPVRLYLTDGSTVDVDHPDLCLLLRRTAIIGLPALPKDQDEGDRFSIIDLAHVSRADTRGTPKLSEAIGEE